MQTSSRPPSRSMAIPGKPEAGLAEWTQRIKAMQRQVDADEEEEHRRLEDDIRRSRIARARRSTGYGSRSATPLEPFRTSPPHRSPPFDPTGALESEDGSDDASPIPDRQREQANALSKLAGASAPSHSPVKSPEPVSLAAFIGGRATGPRLNKHAPQQDAHDPTLFDQRSVSVSTAPHPIFGRGGVAMPGLAAKGRARTDPISEAVVSPEPEPVLAPSNVNVNGNGQADARGEGRVRWEAAQESEEVAIPRRERKNSNALRRYIDHVETRGSPAPSPSLKPESIRTRTLSTPALPRPQPLSPPAASKLDYNRPVTPKTTSFVPSTTVPASLRNVSPSYTITSPPYISKSPAVSYVGQTSLSASVSPKAAPAPSSPKSASYGSAKPSPAPVGPKPAHLASSSPKPASTLATPSLARSVQPAPKPSPFAAQPPPSFQPSPAFLRASPGPKDLTPSLTRLKGRGFVQSIVQASSQLEAAATAPTEHGQLPSPSSGGKRLSSVVERWKAPAEAQTAPVTTPTAPPAPKKAFRRSWTAEATAPTPEKPAPRSVSNVPLKPSADEEEPSWRDIEAQSRKVIKKTASATSLRKAPSSTSLHVRKKSSAVSLRKKSSASSLVAPAPDAADARPPSPGGRPMGSSSTMFSYIKPMKTGDDASSQSHFRPATPAAKARSDVGTGTGSMRGELPPSGKPLSHVRPSW
jgi:hypothetical protein